MIELVSSDRCVQCGLCVNVCPTRVFEPGPGRVPVIARQADCQTCFICEAYCPADALYVSPYADVPIAADEEELAVEGRLGSWRQTVGWGRGEVKLAAADTTPFIDRYLPNRPSPGCEETAFVLGAAVNKR